MQPTETSPDETQNNPAFPVHTIGMVNQVGQPCIDCGKPTPVGLVGFRHQQPLCDLCFMDACPALCMMAYLNSVTRRCHRLNKIAPGHPEPIETLFLFAEVFEVVMNNQGFPFSPRSWALPQGKAGGEEGSTRTRADGDG